jgi:recombinase|nr:MAG TPA: integrase [Caudoviricetes sp.]
MKEYCIYLRKSRADAEAEARGDGETLARHEKTLMEFAKKHDYPIHGTYREIVSADTISARPEMQRLIEEVQAGRWAGVLCMEVERLARGDTIDQGIVAQAFKCSNTLIITPQKTYDPNNEMDEEYFEFSLFMARREYKTIKRRLQAGRLASTKEGNYLGTRAPYGYVFGFSPEDGRRILVVHEETAALVRSAFGWYAQGVTSAEIARRLNAAGARTNYGHLWNPGRVRDMLHTPVYCGKIRWNQRVSTPKIENGQRVVKRPRSDKEILVDGKHTPIVDRALYDQVQAMLCDNRNTARTRSDCTLKNPYAGLLFCGQCGKAMVRRTWARETDSVYCRTLDCPTSSISVAELTESVIDILDTWEKMAQSPAKERRAANQAATFNEPLADKCRETIRQAQAQMERLQDLLEQGIYSPEEYVKRRDVLRERISDARTELAGIEGNRPKMSDAEKIRALLPRIRDVSNALKAGNREPEELNAMLKTVINRIYYYKTERGKRNVKAINMLSLQIYPQTP